MDTFCIMLSVAVQISDNETSPLLDSCSHSGLRITISRRIICHYLEDSFSNEFFASSDSIIIGFGEKKNSKRVEW